MPEAPGVVSFLRARTRCRSTSARASTCASASPRISRPTIAAPTICACRPRSAHRIRGDCRRTRRAAARIAAGQDAAARVQPAAAAARRHGRAGDPRGARAARLRALRRRSTGRARRSLRAVRVAAAARETLRLLAAEAGLCWTALGSGAARRAVLRAPGAQVRRRLRRRRNARRASRAAARSALRRMHSDRWPYPGTIGVRETSITGERIEIHVFRDWCWLGTARDESELPTHSQCSTAGRIRSRHLPPAGQAPASREHRAARARCSRVIGRGYTRRIYRRKHNEEAKS